LGIEIDWTNSGIVSPVKNQGSSCSASWASITTDVLWSFAKKKG
jgi:hypothetical protein